MNETKEVMPMTNTQAHELQILTRIDELERLEAETDDPVMLKYIAERKKVLRIALDKHLNT